MYYESDIVSFVDDDNLCQYQFSRGDYISDVNYLNCLQKYTVKLMAQVVISGINIIISNVYFETNLPK
jgi:hypothetical protein